MLFEKTARTAEPLELDDELLDNVTGGGYSREDWVLILKAMNDLEKKKEEEGK